MANKIDRLFLRTVDELGGRRSLNKFQGVRWYPRNNIPAALHHIPKKRISFLRIDPKEWKRLNQNQREGIIKHEAIHSIAPRHDSTFKFYAKRLNAPITFNQALGGKYQVMFQEKKGQRFKLASEFDTEQAARNYIYSNKGANKAWRIRL